MCVSSGLCLEFSGRWDAECCLKSLGLQVFWLGSYLYIWLAKIKHFGCYPNSGLRRYSLTHHGQKTPEEKYIPLMEASYITKDKNTRHKLMQKANQVLKDAHAAVDRIDSEAA